MREKQNKILRRMTYIVAITIGISILTFIAFVFAKYVLNKKDEAKLNFYEYRIASSEIVISPETYTGEEVIVTITTEKEGLSIQYKLGDSEEWTDYTGPFSVDDNINIEARLVAEDFKGPVTEKEITNIAVCKIGNTYYKTVKAAVDACPEDAGMSQKKIEMLTSVTESVTIPEGKNIVLDLCGKTITSSNGSTIAVEGTFNLIDSVGEGKVESTQGPSIVVKSTGSLTNGTNESEPDVKNSPVIIGENYGVVVEEGGEFNFYDGEISGKIEAIDGNVTKVPDTYVIVTSNKGEYEVATLRKTYVITYNKNSEDAEIEYESQIVNSGEKIGKLPTAQRKGYIFEGWYTEASNGEKVTIETIVNDEVTYYAHWTAIKYIIKYNVNGGSGTVKETEVEYNKDITLPENTYVAPKGYTFKEWNTNADGNGTSYKEGDIVKNLSSTQSEIINLYAIWEDKQDPSKDAPTGTSTTNTITVNCDQKDEGSGIDETTIEYSIFKDGEWSDWQTSNTFEGLEADTEYQIKTRATDKDGNGPIESEIGKVKTKNIQIGTITLHKGTPDGEVVTPKTNKEDKDEPINNDIYIDITPAEEGTTIVKVKKLPDGETKTYTEDTSIETETGVYEITIETTDGTNTVTETVYVFIDKTPPSVEPTETHTTNKITIDPNAKDDDSGIKEIKYVVKNGDEEITTIIKTSGDLDKTAEVSGLKDNTEYTVEITVTDNAGNESTKTVVVKTEELKPGSIEFTESTSRTEFTPTTNKEEDKVWTNENVQTKLTPGSAGTTTYTIQKVGEDPSKKYTNDTEISTTDGDYIVTVETTDGTNTKIVTYYFSVDKLMPTVTITPNGAEHTIAVDKTTVDISATLTSKDNENGSGISINKYAWSTSKEEEPDSWTDDFVSGTPVTKTVNGGVYYLWTKVIDNAGNEAVSIKTSKEFNVGYAVEYDLNGGNGTIEKQRKVHGQDLTLTAVKPTKEGYIFKGWATSENAVSSEYSSSSIYSKDESVKLYAVWSEVIASTTIDGKTTNYDSVQNAINAAETNTAVVTLLKNEIDESVTIAAGQTITLDMNGKTLRSDKMAVTNNGILQVNGEGVISNTASELPTISNNGNLEITNGTISSENYQAINNASKGLLTISGGKIDAKDCAINNYGTSSDELNPSLKIVGGTVKSTTGYSIENVSTGTVVIHKGEISGVRNRNLAKIIMTGGIIENTNGHAIRNYTGDIEIRGGTIISSDFHDGIWTSGTGNVLVTGGTITGGTNGVVTTDGKGKITITGGTVKATSSYNDSGRAIASTGTVIIGNKEDSKIANIEEPILIGYRIGIGCDDIRFYDGIIKAPKGATIAGEVTETPRGYRVTNGEETIDGVKYETAYLDRADVEIEIDQTEYTYTGEEITPEIRVLDEDIVLVKGEDYDVTYSDNVEVGTGTIKVDLKGDYSGTKTITFTINKAILTPVATSDVKTYDGTTTAEGTVYLVGSVNNELPTVSDTYKFEFEDSTSGTNKKVNVTNIQLASSWEKNYTLSTNTLTLTDGAINKATLLAKYEGEKITYGQTPSLKVVVTGFVNNEDENTADEYKAPNITNINKEVGTYTLIPAGGEATNYTFEYEGGTLVIEENMANVIVTLNPEKYVYDGEEKKPEVIVTDKNTGKELTYGTDYTMSYKDNINAGTASVTINLKGNYSGTVIETFTIERASGEAILSIDGWTYGDAGNNPIIESSTNEIESVTYTYTGTKNNGEQYSSNITPTDAGNYTVKAILAQTTNYNQIILEENFVIAKCVVAIPTANTELKYTGNAQTGVESGSNYAITGNVETNAGNYEAIATLSDGNNYEWDDKTVESKRISWQIAKIKLTPIATIEDKIYDGTTSASGHITLQGAVNEEEPSATATFTYESADCGEQTVNVTDITLDDEWKTNYELVTDNLEATGNINKKEITVTKEDYTGVYDGKEHGINVTPTPLENVEIYYSTTELTSNNYNVDGSKDKITMVNSGITTVYYYVHDLTGNYEDYASYAHSNNGTITISKVTLSVSASTNAKQYDGSTNATGTITLEGAVNSEKPTAAGRFAFETKDAVTRKTVNVEDITLDGDWNTNYTLNSKELVLTDGTITAKEVNPVLTAEDKTYDGTTNAAGTINLDGIIDGDDISAVASSYTFDTKDSGTEKTVIASEITLSGKDSNNYVLNDNKAVTKATITKVKLTPKVTVENKVYDGTIDAKGNVDLEGAVNGEKPTAIATLVFKDKDVGTEKEVTVTNITIGNEWSTNYELTEVSDKTADITKATLKATYAGETILFGKTPKLEIKVTGFVNGENESTAEDYNAPTISKPNTQVGNYELIPLGGSARNYDFIYEGGTLIIEPNNSNLTVSLDNYEYTYTGNEHRPQVTVQAEEVTLIEGQDYDVTYTNNIDAGAATVTITLKGNYTGTITESFTINKAEGIAQVTMEGWTYGEDAKSPAVTSTTNEVDNVVYIYYIDEQCTTKTTSEQGATEIGGKPVNSGTYYVKATVPESKNYKEVQVSTSFEIKRVILTPMAVLDSKTYDGTTKGTGKITFVEAVNNEIPTATAIFTYEDATSGTGKTVNVTEIELTSDWDTNYELSKNSMILTNGVINKAVLTVTYKGETINYGEAPKLEVILTGFVNGETEDVIETKPTVKNENTKVGTYTLTPEGGNATNYEFSMVSGTLTINKKSIQDMNVSLDKTSYIYDGTEKKPVVTVLYGEIRLVKDVDYTVSYTNNVNAGTANVVITGIGNYEGTITKEFTIEKANMNVEVTNYTGTYDGKSHTITLKTTPSDNINIYYSTTIALTNSNYLMMGDTSMPSRIFAGTDTVYYYIHDKSGNYNDYSSNANNKNGKIKINSKTILSEDITAILDETTFIYNGKAKEPTPTIKDGETILTVGTDYTVKYEDNINAGTAKVIITGTGSYSGELELTFTITKKVLTVNVTAENKVYDGTNTASCEILLAGVVDGENVTVTSSSSKFENSTVGTGKTVTITGITLHGEDSVNYKLEATTATTKANITKKELIATYVSETIEYGETPKLEVTVTGFAGSETAQTAAGYTAPEVNNTNTAIGEYKLTPANGTATNYSFKYVSGTLTIDARSNVTVTLSQTSYTYDGSAKTPTVTVKDNETGATVSTDNYTVTYTNNVNAGTATVKITLKGVYSGTVNKTFTIKKATRTITATTPQYVGKGVNRNVTFTYTGNSDVTATVASSATATVTATMTDGDKGGTVKITGVAAGTGVVTITVPEDANYNKVTKTINVTVTDFTIAPTTGTIAKGGTITITPTITPTSIVNTDAATTISWKSSSTGIATVSNGSTTKGAKITVTGVANGTATITATLNGQSKTAKITVNSVASTTIGDKTTYYTTVQKAIDAAGTSSATVKLLYSGSRTEAITVAQGQNITLNTNGATLTSEEVTITNEGILTINGNGTITSIATGIENKESGRLVVSDITIDTTLCAIRNYSSINTENSPAVKITSGTIRSKASNTLVNHSSATGLIVVNGGTISSEQMEQRPTVINYQGKIIIAGGEITSTNERAVCQYQDTKGIIEIRDGIINGTIGLDVNAGEIIVTGGTIIGNSAGAVIREKGILTVGTNETTPSVSTTVPSITGNEFGIDVRSGTFNFYDGIIMGPTGKSINGTVTKTPDGYVVVKGSKTVDSTTYETSVLGPSAPVVTAKLNNSSGAAYTSGAWTNKSVYVTLSSSNVGAGIKAYQWYENGAWVTRALTTSNNVGTITYSATRNETIRFRAIDNNGVISAEATFTVRVDKTSPTITVSPTSATACKQTSVTITVADTGGSSLSSSNSYQYYLSSSSTALSGGSWKNYTSGTSFTIGTGVTGTRYLFVKRVSDNAGNVSTANGIAQEVSGVTYQRFGSYVFDNTNPITLINTESMYVTDGLVTRLDGVNNNGGSKSESITTWKDISSNGKNGTISSGTWGGNYLDFNGTSTWVNLGVMNSDYQTIEVTFSPDIVPTSETKIMGNWQSYGGGIGINSNGYIYGNYYIDGSFRTITSRIKVVANKNYHVAFTYNGNTVILYVNGVEQGRVSVSGTIVAPTSSTVMALGTNPSGSKASGEYFDGKIYTAAVYNKALTAAQVKTNADAGKALAGGPTNASSITYTIRFNEEVTGFTTDNIKITNGTKGAFTTVTEGRAYKVAVTTTAGQNNTQTIAIIANGSTDSAGNEISVTGKTVIIDRVAPTVTLSTNGGTYNITPGNTTISVGTTPTVSETGSGIAGLSYAWSTSNSKEPSSWTEFTSGTAITKALSGGNNYIWTNVIDNAGNRATSVKTSSSFTVRYQIIFTGTSIIQYKVHGTALTLSSTKPNRIGYTFKEWNTKADGTGTSYAPGASYTANSAVALYAIWNVNNYTITYDYNYFDDDIYGTKPLTTNFSSSTATGTTSRADNSSAKYGKEIRYTITKAGTGGAHLSPGRLTVGNTYTWSVYLKASKNVTINLGSEQNGRKQVNVTTSWQRFTHTFTAGDTTYNSFTFYATGGSSWDVGDAMYMHSLELKETPTLNITTQSKAYNTTLGTLTTPTRANYAFQGWYTAPTGGTKISSTTTVPAANTTYYAHWTYCNYTEYKGTTTTVVKYYSTLADALNGVSSGNTIKPLLDFTETKNATLASGKTAILDLNGKTISMQGYEIINLGNLTVQGSGKISSTNVSIRCKENGNLTVGNVTVESQSNDTIYNEGKGTVTINGATVTSSLSAISQVNGGTVTVNSGNITGDNAIFCSNGTVNVYSGTLTGTKYYGISIFRKDDGTVTVNVGKSSDTLSKTNPAIIGKQCGIMATLESTLNFNNGILKGENERAIAGAIVTNPRSGYDVIYSNDGTYHCATLGIANYAEYRGSTLVNNYGTLVDAMKYVTDGNTIKVLKNRTENSVATLASEKNVTFNLNGKTITTSANVNTIVNEGTLTVQDSAGSGTIRNTLTTASVTIINNKGTLTFSGNNNFTISGASTSASQTLINNSGTATLSKGTLEQTGTLAAEGTSYRYIVNGTGALTISGAELKNTSSTTTIYDRGVRSTRTITVSSGTITTKGATICSAGTATSESASATKITGGTMKSTSHYGIVNAAAGLIYINSANASITGSNYGIYNNTTGNVKLANGEIIAGSSHGIYNNSTGTITVTGGSITSTAGSGIYNKTTGVVTVTGGSITASGGTGIYNNAAGTVTIGTNESTPSVSTTVPSITGKVAGINVGTGTFNFYDGVIKGQSGSGSSIKGTISAVPTGYGAQKTTLVANSVTTETAILVIANYEELTSSGAHKSYYATLSSAMTNVTSGNTIKALNSNITENATATLASGKTAILEIAGKTINMQANEIVTLGNLTIQGNGRINSTNISIRCKEKGNLALGNAVITAQSGDAIRHEGTGTVSVDATNITSSLAGISLGDGGTVTVNAGNIKGDSAIYCVKGTVNVYSGTLTGTKYAGIQIFSLSEYSVTVTIGKSTNSVSTNPSITGDERGIFSSQKNNLHFYNGMIRGKQESIGVNLVTNVRSGYTIDYSNNGTYNIAKLVATTSTASLLSDLPLSIASMSTSPNRYTVEDSSSKLNSNNNATFEASIEQNNIDNASSETSIEQNNNDNETSENTKQDQISDSNVSYAITTDVIEHTESYKNGKISKNVKGGNITGEDENPYETVLQGKMPQKAIKISPTKTNDGEYEIAKVIIKDGKDSKQEIELDLSTIVDKDGNIELPVEYLADKVKGMQCDKHIEVEFRKKTKVIVKYLEKDTQNVLYKTKDGKDYEEITGYEGMHFEINRRPVTNYYASSVEVISDNKLQGIHTDEKMFVTGEMYADTLTIIYWYEKAPNGIVVKHIEIDEQDKKNGLTLDSGFVLDEEIINYKSGDTKTIGRITYDTKQENKYKTYISMSGPKSNSENIVIATREEASKEVTYTEDSVIEVRYYYERKFDLNMEVKAHNEVVNGVQTEINGGKLNSNQLKPYEVILKNGSNDTVIEFIPEDGYRVKYVKVNGKVLNIDNLEQKNHSIVFEKGYFKNVLEDINIVVEFERIPAKVIVKYQDVDTQEDLIPNKEIIGFVNDEYNEKAVKIEGFIVAANKPDNSSGRMTEDIISMTYWYTRRLSIRNNARRSEEESSEEEESEEE